MGGLKCPGTTIDETRLGRLLKLNMATNVKSIKSMPAVLLLTVLSFITQFVIAGDGIPSVPPGRAWQWEIWKKDNLIEKEFVVSQVSSMQFLVGFAGDDAADDSGMVYRKASQSWRELLGTFDPENGFTGSLAKWMGSGYSPRLRSIGMESSDAISFFSIPEIEIPGQVGNDGRIVFRNVSSGVVVPIQVTLQRIEKNGQTQELVNRVVDTAGTMSGGELITRVIFWARLKQGTYKISAKPTIDTPPIPFGARTYLYIRKAPPG